MLLMLFVLGEGTVPLLLLLVQLLHCRRVAVAFLPGSCPGSRGGSAVVGLELVVDARLAPLCVDLQNLSLNYVVYVGRYNILV